MFNPNLLVCEAKKRNFAAETFQWEKLFRMCSVENFESRRYFLWNLEVPIFFYVTIFLWKAHSTAKLEKIGEMKILNMQFLFIVLCLKKPDF